MIGKTVVVTGSSRGIGYEIAKKFYELGANVVLNSSKSYTELSKACEVLTGKEGKSHCILGDVSVYPAAKKVIYETLATFSKIDVLINNAGISYVGLFTEMDYFEWDSIIKNNLYSVLNCTRFALPDMIRRKEGHIINISSIWGEVGASCEAVYSATKGAINAFTKSMAKEVGPSNIKVNAIACGVIDTTMNNFLSDEEKLKLQDNIPLMRLGEGSEIGDFCVSLVKSNYITGQVISIDGGMT